jgi:murein DD-endopeptidase MepM/ murein hydrolase activator NlpD
MNRLNTFLLLTIVFYACKTSSGVFAKKTLHEQYADKLNTSGLNETALGTKWFEAASKAINTPAVIKLPYKENGYFATDRPEATGLQFVARRGEQILIELTKLPTSHFLLFADLFQLPAGGPKYIQSIDTLTNTLRLTVKENGNFILRLQPELLKSGSYTIVIRTGPSLAFPIASPAAKNRIISYWGSQRDAGARSHEGVDIGGNFRTPLIAVGNGTVTSVSENNLGGKVVFIRSDETNETWYYAHLDSQIATPGQHVKTGDLVGLMGNTGNARNTVPHLHFGIYTNHGAVDPLPYLEENKKEPRPITAPLSRLGTLVRIGRKPFLQYPTPDTHSGGIKSENMPVFVTGATAEFYKTISPGGEKMFVPAITTLAVEKGIAQLTLKDNTALYDAPAENAPVIKTVNAGGTVDLLGTYNEFKFISAGGDQGWIRP